MSKLAEVLARLGEIKARAEKASRGPWTADPHYPIYVWGPRHAMVADLPMPGDEEAYLARMRGVGRGASAEEQQANCEFTAAARTDVPDMAAALDEAVALLRKLEWAGVDMPADPGSTMGPWACCPCCGVAQFDQHARVCALAEAVGATRRVL